MVTRRLLFQIFLGQSPQTFGPTNTPQCPVCRTSMPADFPPYTPLVGNSDGTSGRLTNVRECLCANCGVRFVVSTK